MERRKLLLGSGAALATVLAGCSGSDTGDEDPDEEPEDTEDENESDGDESDQEGEEETDERADVPGFDSEAFSFDSDAITVDRIEYEDDGDEGGDGNETDAEGGDSPQGVVSVHATADVDDREELYAELDSLAADAEAPVDDISELKESVQRIELSFVDADEEELDTLSIMPLWVYEYMEEQVTGEQFLQQVLSTSEQNGN